MNLRAVGFFTVLATALFSPTIVLAAQTAWMRGGNWADPRDNYVDGLILPSGLTEHSTIAEASAKAHQIALDLKSVVDGPRAFVRMGINPQTVGDQEWWARFSACVDQLNADGLDVILACWEGTNKDGLVDANWKTMWQAVQSRYGNNDKVWFEPINEPFGYNTAALIELYKDYLSWIGKSQDRIILDGTGYSDHVNTIGAAFPLCTLGLHIYPWYGGHKDEGRWKEELLSRIGEFQDRTVITEMGAPATTGLDFGASSNDVNVAFIRGVTEQVRALKLGLCYWPLHRDGDTYRLFNDTSGGGFTNESLRKRLRHGWNF